MDLLHNHVLYGSLQKKYPVIVKGEGVYVYDDQGNRYLDAIGGVCVVNIGHTVQEIIKAITEQARLLAYSYSGEVDNLPRQSLAKKLDQWAPAGMGDTRTFFCSGGAEANESALKIGYQYHCERGHPGKLKVIGRWQSYHGNTIAALSMGGRTTWRSLYGPYLLPFPHIPPPYCYRCPWGLDYPQCAIQCAHELERVIRQEGPENISAFIAEPIIGTSMSAVVPPPEYYPIIREICDHYDVLFIADEVMSGVGRTGKKWAIEHWEVSPDILTTAKGIAGGYAPLAATILSNKIWQAFNVGSQSVLHSYTYGGNPLSCTAGNAVLTYIEEHQLIQRAGQMGDLLLQKLAAELSDLPWVGDIRGKGLFAGVELVEDKETKQPFPVEQRITSKVEEAAFQNGLMVLGGAGGLIDGVQGDHIELVPPYTIDADQVDFIATTLRKSITQVIKNL